MSKVKYKMSASYCVEMEFDVTPEQLKMLRDGADPNDDIPDFVHKIFDKNVCFCYNVPGG